MKPKFFDAELLSMYLTSPQAKLNFSHLKDNNHEAINRLKTLKDQSLSVLLMINYIQKLNELINNYCTTTKPFEKARKLFSDYVVALNPKHRKILKSYAHNIYENDDTNKALFEFCLKAENEPKECFSGEMTIRKAIEFGSIHCQYNSDQVTQIWIILLDNPLLIFCL